MTSDVTSRNTPFRGTPSDCGLPRPPHDTRLIGRLADALVAVWQELDPPLRNDCQPADSRVQTVAAGGC